MSLQGTIGRILRSSQSIASITRAAAALQAAEHCPRWYSTPSSDGMALPQLSCTDWLRASALLLITACMHLSAAEASTSGGGAAVAPAQEPAGPRVRRKWTRKERGSWVENGYLMREASTSCLSYQHACKCR